MNDPIRRFFDEYRWLSNFAPSRIILDGMEFASVEHAYQSAKSEDLSWKILCQSPISAGGIKRSSRMISTSPTWDDARRLATMKICLDQKFRQSPYYGLLLQTEDRLIEEGNTWGDRFWGVDEATGNGENHLGKMIMEIREDLRFKG